MTFLFARDKFCKYARDTTNMHVTILKKCQCHVQKNVTWKKKNTGSKRIFLALSSILIIFLYRSDSAESLRYQPGSVKLHFRHGRVSSIIALVFRPSLCLNSSQTTLSQINIRQTPLSHNIVRYHNYESHSHNMCN